MSVALSERNEGATMPADSPVRLRIIPITRHCPSCRTLLRPVAGGRGKVGCCVRCGYTGPVRGESR
jgi:hypothetical protein